MALVELVEGSAESEISSLSQKDRTEPVDYGSCSEAESTFSDIASQRHNSIRHVVFHNISYEVDQRDRCFRKLRPKKVLHHVSGIMRTGLNVIMGPTGSGKTTLLDILAGHKDKRGKVVINGEECTAKARSACVIKDGIVMGTLTVKENITFSAALRLPSTYTRRDRRRKVDLVIKELGLTAVADKKVGATEGISKRERKLTNIGMELVLDDGVVFLDEPTAGLDVSSALSLIRVLKRASKQNRVIILSIHQSQYSVYELFDTLTLLSNGYLVYHGPAGDTALQYFKNLGYKCRQHDNPADFFLNVVVQNEIVKQTGMTLTMSLCNNQLALAYKDSSQHDDTNNEVMILVKEARNRTDDQKFAVRFLWQVLVLSARTMKNLIRNPISTIQVMVIFILATLVGTVFFQLKNNFAGYQNRTGALTLITVMTVVFGGISAAVPFLKERPLFVQEAASSYYRISAYFISKVVFELLPMNLIMRLIFSAITYWMIGLKKDIYRFTVYFMTILLTSLSASTTTLLISAGIRKLYLISICIPVVFVTQLVFGGFLINLNSLSSWLSWIQYLSIFRYALNALYTNELENGVYCDRIFNQTNDNMNCLNENLTVYGDIQLESMRYSDQSILANELGLLIYVIVMLTCIYITLRFVTVTICR
ncbi:broad substrate specificity ATP-binding cassette transporter ABCG2-like isoform X2 [Dysidea avara]|uniref:broad substrate specificity ATP-binding cassette transporter ABCG2-like isoform X2 n=1 Tax=Dysidea avara TaxID=196820 RepID=UPI00331979CC